MSNNLFLDLYVKQSVRRYVNFMGIEEFPDFDIVTKHISLDAANAAGWGSFATHHYKIPTNTHCLEVWENINQPQLHAEYLLFHEFTHILDTATYVNGDKIKNVKYRGFTEYHAGQIDLLKILGTENINQIFTFSMNQVVETIGNRKTVKNFVNSAHDTAVELVGRKDFPANIETLVTVFGLMFNYWGRRSICEMYATDFQEDIDNTVLEKFIGKEAYTALDRFMHGWFDENQITLIGEFYLKMAISKFKEYSF